MNNRTKTRQNRLRIAMLFDELQLDNDDFIVSSLLILKEVVQTQVERGEHFLLVCGGSSTAKNYQSIAQACCEAPGGYHDSILSAAARLDALLMQDLVSENAYPLIIASPRVIKVTPDPIIVAFNSDPGMCPDFASVLFAKNYGCARLIKVTGLSAEHPRSPDIGEDLLSNCRVCKGQAGRVVSQQPNFPLLFCSCAFQKAASNNLEVVSIDISRLKQYFDGISAPDIVISPITNV